MYDVESDVESDVDWITKVFSDGKVGRIRDEAQLSLKNQNLKRLSMMFCCNGMMSFRGSLIERCITFDVSIPKHPSIEFRLGVASGSRQFFLFVREVCADVIACLTHSRMNARHTDESCFFLQYRYNV